MAEVAVCLPAQDWSCGTFHNFFFFVVFNEAFIGVWIFLFLNSIGCLWHSSLFRNQIWLTGGQNLVTYSWITWAMKVQFLVLLCDCLSHPQIHGIFLIETSETRRSGFIWPNFFTSITAPLDFFFFSTCRFFFPDKTDIYFFRDFIDLFLTMDIYLSIFI